MSKLPQHAREAFIRARVEFEPGAARLARARARLQVLTHSAAEVPAAYDVAPPCSKVVRSYWRWVAPLLGGAAVWLAVSSQGAPAKPREERVQPSAARVESEALQPLRAPAKAEQPAAQPPREPLQMESTAKQPESGAAEESVKRGERQRVSATRSRAGSTRVAAVKAPSVAPVEFVPAPAPAATAEPAANTSARSGSEPVEQSRRVVVPQSQLGSELILIAGARTALRQGDHTRAKQLLSEHRSSYPSGQLLAERLSLLVRLHCTMHEMAQARETFEALRTLHVSGLEQAARESCGSQLR